MKVDLRFMNTEIFDMETQPSRKNSERERELKKERKREGNRKIMTTGRRGRQTGREIERDFYFLKVHLGD